MLYLYLVLNLIFLALVILIATQFFNLLFRGCAPFISTKYQIINEIFKEVKFVKNFSGNVYELGAGRAGFLRAFEEKYPQAKLIGVEHDPLPYLIAKIQLALEKSKIKLRRKNMFKINLADADVIYCYLNQKMMKKLESKFKQECKSGTVIISYQFILPNIKTEKILELSEISKVYIYKI